MVVCYFSLNSLNYKLELSQNCLIVSRIIKLFTVVIPPISIYDSDWLLACHQVSYWHFLSKVVESDMSVITIDESIFLLNCNSDQRQRASIFAACVDVMGSASGWRCRLKWYDLAVMHVVDTIFIISVSNSWIFTYHDKWNSHGKIVNSCCPFHGNPPYLLRECLRTEFVITPPVRI